MLKKKTLKRLQTALDDVIPKKKLDTIYGAGNSAALKKQIIGYCCYLLYNPKKPMSFQDYVEANYSGQRQGVDEEIIYINIVYSGKDGIHFKIQYSNFTLDFRYSCRMAEIRERKEENKYQRQQFKYAARQNRRKK